MREGMEVKMKPMMIVPPKTFSEGDLQLLRDNGICIVETADPAAVRFVDPLPVVSSRSEMERAAIALSRKLLTKGHCPWNDTTLGDIARMFADLLLEGTSLDADRVQLEESTYNEAHHEEIRKIAREDARAARAAKKTEKK